MKQAADRPERAGFPLPKLRGREPDSRDKPVRRERKDAVRKAS